MLKELFNKYAEAAIFEYSSYKCWKITGEERYRTEGRKFEARRMAFEEAIECVTGELIARHDVEYVEGKMRVTFILGGKEYTIEH